MTSSISKIEAALEWGDDGSHIFEQALAECQKLKWQPIETAPKHKDVLFCVDRSFMVTGRVLDGGFRCIGTDWPVGSIHKPTHWMPLPEPPQSIVGEDDE